MMILCGRRAKLLQSPDWPAERGHWLPTHRAPENSLRRPDFSWSESDLAPPETHSAQSVNTHEIHWERKLGVGVCVCPWYLSEALEHLGIPLAQLGDENHGAVQHAYRSTQMGITKHLFLMEEYQKTYDLGRRRVIQKTLRTVVLLSEEGSSCGSK